MVIPVRAAACWCGALTATCTGAPVRVSVCHCLDCKRRTGSAFSYNATFDAAAVAVAGVFATFRRTSDDGGWGEHNFCPTCGGTVFYTIEARPGMVSIPVGAFADPDFAAPQIEVYEGRRHSWCVIAGIAPPTHG